MDILDELEDENISDELASDIDLDAVELEEIDEELKENEEE